MGRRLFRWRRATRDSEWGAREIATALSLLDDLGARDQAPEKDAEAPVFVLGVSWRSGSTLLQRALMSDHRLLLWGEPLGLAHLIPRIAQGICLAAHRHTRSFLEGALRFPDGTLETSWIANLYPEMRGLRSGLRGWLLEWLAAPARSRGFPRWGLKEVRFGAGEGFFLRWLFPGAKIVVIVRNPLDAYLSLREAQRVGPWPEPIVRSAESFAEHWNRLALSWTEATDLSHVLVKYEDIVAGKIDLGSLGGPLELTIAPSLALEARVGSSPRSKPLSSREGRLIRSAARAGMAAFGYT